MSRRRQRVKDQAEPEGQGSRHSARSEQERKDLTERLPSLLCVLAFLFFSWILANITPLAATGSFINTPDESAHIGYIQAIAMGHRLPVKDDPQFPTYQWHQPPFYYAVAAPVYHLGLHALRAVSLLFALVSLYAIWSAARLLFPKRPLIWALSTGFGALLPMRQAVMASVGNDAATECFFSLTLYCLLLMIIRGVNRNRIVALTVLLSLGLLTKATCLLLLPVALVAVFLATGKQPLRQRVGWTVVPVIAALVVASPWYVRNARLYGEALPMRTFHQEFAGTSRAADWIGKQPLQVDAWTGDLRPGPIMTGPAYAWLVANWTARTFYAAYTPRSKQSIGAPVFLPPTAYLLFGIVTGLGFIGAVWRLFEVRQWQGVVLATVITLGLALVLVLASFAAFASTYFQAQGRYLYPALLPLSLMWAAGIERITPSRYRSTAAIVLFVLFVAVAAAFCFLYVLPAYRGSS